MSIYQFLIAVRQRDGEMLQNSEGETTRYVEARQCYSRETLMRVLGT